MIKTIIILIVIIAALAVAVDIFRVAVRVKKGKELSARAVPFQRLNLQAKMRILILGDSTGVGTGAEDNNLTVAGRFGQAFPDAEIVNKSQNGWRVHDAREFLDTADLGKFDLIILQIGANDIIRFTPLSNFSQNLASIFKRAKAMSPVVAALHSGNVGLAPFFPRWIGPLYSWRTRQVRAIYSELASDSGVIYVDLYTDRAHDPLGADVAKNYAPDGLHLTGAGYGVWYAKIQDALLKASK